MNENEVSSVDSVKRCPICGGELERGYIISRAMWWDRQKHNFRGGEDRLTQYPMFTQDNFSALRCRNCRLVLFTH